VTSFLVNYTAVSLAVRVFKRCSLEAVGSMEDGNKLALIEFW
jgi:hypothetical protein